MILINGVIKEEKRECAMCHYENLPYDSTMCSPCYDYDRWTQKGSADKDEVCSLCEVKSPSVCEMCVNFDEYVEG